MTTIPNLLKLLFSTFPPPPSEDGDAQLAAYALALDGHAEQDIEAAVRKLIRGEVPGHNQSFAPSAAMLGSVVIERRNHRIDIESRSFVRNQLPAPSIERTDESRARVAAKLQEGLVGLATTMLTPDVEAERRRQEHTSKVFARFDPKSDREALERLGYSTGNSDVEGDMGGKAA